MKSVALYGFAEATRDGVWKSDASEIWSVVWAYKYHVPRLDRIFEMHPIWFQAKSQKPEYQKARDHWEWLKNNIEIPIYMLIQHPEVPMCRRYPIEHVQRLLPDRRKKTVFTSSFDYLMALAIHEEYTRIETYGFEMGSDTEYRYQREGAAYWIGQCDARGIELILPESTALLKKKMYGYEGGSLIYRQTMEMVLAQREQQFINERAILNGIEGKLQVCTNTEERIKLSGEWDKQYRMVFVVDGAVQQLKMLLQTIDLEEPSDEFLDNYGIVTTEKKDG